MLKVVTWNLYPGLKNKQEYVSRLIVDEKTDVCYKKWIFIKNILVAFYQLNIFPKMFIIMISMPDWQINSKIIYLKRKELILEEKTLKYCLLNWNLNSNIG
jgi:hypothetical protein